MSVTPHTPYFTAHSSDAMYRRADDLNSAARNG
jgi:hypothetical protein